MGAVTLNYTLHLPTYGATPIAVGIKPRYRALTPPSSRITFRVIPHIVRSLVVKIVVVVAVLAFALVVAFFTEEDKVDEEEVAAAEAVDDV